MKKLLIFLLATLLLVACGGNEEEGTDWITVSTFEIEDDMQLEEKAMYTILNMFEPNERLNHKDMPMLEKETTLGTEVKIETIDNNAKQLSLKLRATNYGHLEQTRMNTLKILKNIGPFLEENDLSSIQIYWTIPSELGNGAKIEPSFYHSRFDTSTLLNTDWNATTFNDYEKLATYLDIEELDYK